MARKIADDPEFDAEATINLLDQRLARLRVLYEQYFLGIEKRQPTTPQKEVVRLIRLVEKHKIRNTSLKFRFNGIVQKFTSYRAYWLRTCRQIENGTYVRHKQRVQSRDKRRKSNTPDNAPDNAPDNVPSQEPQIDDQSNALADDFLRSLQLEIDKPSDGPPPPPDTRPNLKPPVHTHDTATTTPSTAPRPQPSPQSGSATEKLRRLRAKLNRPSGDPQPQAPVASQAQRNASREAGISNDRLQSIYKSLVTAKQRCSEPTAKISVDSVARSIAKQAPLIKQKHNAKSVDFKVVIKNGKAYLKPVPKP